MKLVSVIPESFQEYEDHISIILFFFGCNFKCVYCYNYDTVTNIKNILKETPEEILEKYVTPLTDGLVLLGGEPTIYGNKLLELASYAKEKYNLDVKLFTNGSNPELVIEGLQTGSLDNVSIDFKFFTSKNIVDFKSDDLNHRSYTSKLIMLLNKIRELNLHGRVEVRTTKDKSMTDIELDLIKNLCRRVEIPHITQAEVSASYKRLGML